MAKLTVHCCHHKSNLGGVSSAGEVRVDLLLFGLVQGNESVEDVVASRRVVGTALVIGEVVLHRANGELLLEAIDLVEEENDRGLDEPPGVADRVEQSQGFLHTVDGLVFEEQLVVLGDGDKEQNGSDVLEAVDPFLALGSLTTNVEHAVCEVTNDECGLGDTGSLDTGTEDILVGGEVVGLGNALNGIEVAKRKRVSHVAMRQTNGHYSLFGRVVQLVFAGALEALLNTSIAPELANGVSNLGGNAVTLDLSGLHEDGLHVVLVARILQGKFERLHGLENDPHRLDGVAVDDFLE